MWWKKAEEKMKLWFIHFFQGSNLNCFKKKKKSNNLIWWYHRRSGIAMLPPTSSKWFQVVASGLGGMQGLEWTATSQPRNTAFLKACHSPWERNTSQKESQGVMRAKSLGWAATSETKVRAQPRLGVPLVFSVAFGRPHCESKTCCPVLETSPCFQDLHCHVPFLWGSLVLVSCTVKFSANQLVHFV